METPASHNLPDWIIRSATRWWAADIGCPEESLFSGDLQILIHRGNLSGYDGIFSIFHEKQVTVSLPPDCAEIFRQMLPAQSLTPMTLADALSSPQRTVIGPAYIGYTDKVEPARYPAREITAQELPDVKALQEACSTDEWDNLCEIITPASSAGCFTGNALASLATFEIWGNRIAHIGVVTHPAHRGHGYGQAAVAHLTHLALLKGLIPQYRALESNVASLRIARNLGFRRFATTVAIRLNRSLP